MIKDESSFMLAAMHSYDNVQCVSLEEFNEDLNRITTIRKAITRYKNGEVLNVRLLLNQLIILFNVFGDKAFDLLRYKISEDCYPILDPLLDCLNRLPNNVQSKFDMRVVDKIGEEINA